MLVGADIPRGGRSSQLSEAIRLLEAYGREGRLLDMGAGTGWLGMSWHGPALALDVVAPEPAQIRAQRAGRVSWIVGDGRQLPLRSSCIDTAVALASLGAFRSDELPRVFQEIARVLRPEGTFLILASARHAVFDRIVVHRFQCREWHHFLEEELVAAANGAGLELVELTRRGGVRSVVADWFWKLLAPLNGVRGLWRVRRALAECDRSDYSPRKNGRFIYSAFRKLGEGLRDL